MKNNRIALKRKKIFKVAAVLLVLGMLAGVLAACGDKDEPTIDFKEFYQTVNDRSYDGYEELITLDENLKVATDRVYTSDTGSWTLQTIGRRTNYTGYIDSYDGFVITNMEYKEGTTTHAKNTLFGFYKAGDDGMTVPAKYDKIYFKHGLIATLEKFSSGTGYIGVYNQKGELLLAHNSEKFSVTGNLSVSSSSKNLMLNNFVELFSEKYVGYKVTRSGSTYTEIINAYTKEVVASLYNTEFSAIRVFDDYMMVTKGTSDSVQSVNIFKLDSTGASIIKSPLSETRYGFFKTEGAGGKNQINATYLGDGKFYVFKRTEGTADDYYFQDEEGGEYYLADAWFYHADKETREPYINDIMPMSLSNHYYANDAAANETVLDISGFLKEGYHYSGYALVRGADKIVGFDQLILDKDFNVVVSLSNTVGKVKDIDGDVRMLGLVFNGNYAVSQQILDSIRVYDRYGKEVSKIEMDDEFYVSSKLSAGWLITEVLREVEDEEGDTVTVSKFGVMDIQGNVIVDYKFDGMTEFVGGYALAWTITDEVYEWTVLDRYLNEYTDNGIGAEIATTANGVPITFNGVYVYKSAGYYGIKNYSMNDVDADIFDGELFADIELIRSNLEKNGDLNYNYPTQIFAAVQHVKGGKYTLYRFTGASSGMENLGGDKPDNKLGIILGSVFGGLAAIGIVVGVVVYVNKKKKKAADTEAES